MKNVVYVCNNVVFTGEVVINPAPAPTTLRAIIAIKGAKGHKSWGAYAARRFIEKCGISPRLYRIARQCEAAES